MGVRSLYVPAIIPIFTEKIEGLECRKCSGEVVGGFEGEIMNSINWTKFYDLYVQNEHFKVFIVQDDTNCFHAGCLWYEVQRVLRIPGEPGDFRVAFETRADTNEQAALDQLKAWVTSKFGKDFKFVASNYLIPGVANYILASMFMRS